MKLIILVSNLKEISPSVFSWKREYIKKKLRCNSTVKIWFGRKKILNYAYVLKNGVDRYNMFLILHKACWILLFVSFRIESVNVLFNSTIRFVSCAFFVNKQFRSCANALPNEFTVWVVWMYEYCAGKHLILYWIQDNKTATYFLRFRLFTYDIMKNFNCN